MANWFHHVFLKRWALLSGLALGAGASPGWASELDVDKDFFEVGTSLGILTVQDFTSEAALGLNASFLTTENFFLQANFFKADISITSAEEIIGEYSDSRTYQHFNALLGYRIFQGEIFRDDYSALSSLYVKAGVGETQFLDEYNFTYVVGAGYQLSLLSNLSVTLDFYHYQYNSIVIYTAQESVRNSQVAIGVNWLF